MSSLLLSYWNIRGRAEPIRMLLSYLQLEYSYKGYDTHQSKEWHQKDKPLLKTPFPNLPYLQYGDKILTESDAIVHHLCFIANRADLLGQTNEDRTNISRFRGFVQENMLQLGATVYNHENLYHKPKAYIRFAKHFGYLEKYLSENKFGNGDKLCAYDFHLYDFIFVSHKFFDDHPLFKTFPHIGDHYKRIQNLPEIQSYFHSNKYSKELMIFGPGAKWNADSSL